MLAGSSDVEEVDTEALCTLISDMVKEMVVKIQSCEVSSDRVLVYRNYTYLTRPDGVLDLAS